MEYWTRLDQAPSYSSKRHHSFHEVDSRSTTDGKQTTMKPSVQLLTKNAVGKHRPSIGYKSSTVPQFHQGGVPVINRGFLGA